MDKNKKSDNWSVGKLNSVSVRLPILFVGSCMIIILIFVVMLYFKFQNRMIAQYSYIAQGATTLMTLELDGDKVDDYIEKNFELEEYQRILNRFYEIRDSYPDILYMYVYRLAPDGGTVVFDLNSIDGTEDAGIPGEHYEFGDVFMEHIDEFCAGVEVSGIAGQTEDGYMLTYCKPVYDSNGVLQCHACVDFSMDALHQEDLKFIYSILLVSGLGTILIMLFGIYRIQKDVTVPLDKMSQATEKFIYETQEDHAQNIRIMKELNINTHNEIEKVYHVFISAMEQSLHFMENLSKAETDIKVKNEQIGQISQEAYRDSLTGVGSKAAYAKKITELNAEILNGHAEFAIVMIDMNNLKKINDECGHKAGDIYIKGCCHLICEIFKHSPVFRIGGDEFVAVLTGQDYQNRYDNIESLRSAYAETYQNHEQELCYRYSASIGMAEYASDDSTVELVFKRADKAMYEDKANFKKQYGSYR